MVLRGYDRSQVEEIVRRAASSIAALTGSAVFSDDPLPSDGRPEEHGPAPIDSAELRDTRLDTVLRGYDRTQVGDFLSGLAERLSDAESRADRG